MLFTEGSRVSASNCHFHPRVWRLPRLFSTPRQASHLWKAFVWREWWSEKNGLLTWVQCFVRLQGPAIHHQLEEVVHAPEGAFHLPESMFHSPKEAFHPPEEVIHSPEKLFHPPVEVFRPPGKVLDPPEEEFFHPLEELFMALLLSHVHSWQGVFAFILQANLLIFFFFYFLVTFFVHLTLTNAVVNTTVNEH